MSSVREQTLAEYVQALGSSAAVPGGGSAAAVTAAMGAALLSMVAKLSAKKARDEADRAVLNQTAPRLDELSRRLLELAQEDIDAYRAVLDARKSRSDADTVARAYERAADVPLSTASAAADALALGEQVSPRAWGMAASDLAVGNDLLQTGMGGALGNVEINLPELTGEAAARIERRYQELRGARRR